MSKDIKSNDAFKGELVRPNTAKVVGEGGSINGVFGSSKHHTGVIGQSETSNGVHGVSDTGNGVTGECLSDGAGVIGESRSGIGVHGKGSHLAGKFEGDVEVTGDLKGQTISNLLQKIEALESGNLLQRIEALEKRLERTQPVHDTYQAGAIKIALFDTTIQLDRSILIRCVLSGSGFTPKGDATIRVVTRLTFVADFQVRADQHGDFHIRFLEFTYPGVGVYIAATNKLTSVFDLTGWLWSNTVSLDLP